MSAKGLLFTQERAAFVKKYPVLRDLITLMFCTSIYGSEIDADRSIPENWKNEHVINVTFPEGVLFGSFSKEDGPFLLEGNVIVPSGQVLEFGPGCTIYVGGQNTSITVYGQIFVRGQKDNPVVFMSPGNNPNPWDWDRIYCRSSNRSIFDHCIIKHSNYGIVVHNGLADIRNCSFENNSIHGLMVKNSEITIIECSFTSGHVSAIDLQEGAICEAESLIIKDNITAVTCHEKSSFKLQKGEITGNFNGIVVSPSSFVSIISAPVTKNKNGVLTTVEIPRKTREMVFGNAYNINIINQSELEKLLNNSGEMKSFVLPQNQISAKIKSDFKPGFLAVNTPPEPVSDFLGNVTAGFKYYKPRSMKNSSDDTVRMQTHYPDKFQPEIQIFANGRRSGADINLLMDIYGNKWLSTEGYVDKRMFSLALSYEQQQLIFGDFFENATETSISGRQITGVKYSGQAIEMGAGNKRIDFTLAAGESEVPKDSGDHEINIYNETVDSGMSIRQQLTYLASLTLRPTRNSSITTRGIIARDQTEKPLFRSPINDPSVADPIEAQTGCIDGNIQLLNEKLEIFAELDLGTHDTISDDKTDDVAWYNPDFKKAVPEIFSLFGSKDFFDHYAFTLGSKSEINGYKIALSGTQIASDYFSAGNPYLEADRRIINLSTDKQFSKSLTVNANYNYSRSSLSKSPEDDNTFNVRGEYMVGENKPTFSIDYTCKFEKMTSSERVETDDTSYTGSYEDNAFSNTVAIEAKQNFINGIDCGLRYQFLYDNDISKHADKKLNDNGDRFQNQIRTWFSFKIKKYIRDKFSIRVATRDENRDSLKAYSYKLQNQLTWNAIPRKLVLNMLGEYSYSKETDIYTEDDPTLISFYKAEMEAKYSISARFSISIMGSYEKSYDETPGSAENYNALITGLHLTCLF